MAAYSAIAEFAIGEFPAPPPPPIVESLEATATIRESTSAAGASFLPSEQVATADGAAPLVAAGCSAFLDDASAIATIDSPSSAAGVSVSPVTIAQIADQGGGIGFGAVGEFAIGEGPLIIRNIVTAAMATADPEMPYAAAGVSVLPLEADASALLVAPESQARRRKPTILTIPS